MFKATHEINQAGSSGRGRGWSQGRRPTRGAHVTERESSRCKMELLFCTATQQSMNNNSSPGGLVGNCSELKEPVKVNRNGAESRGMVDNGNCSFCSSTPRAGPTTIETKNEEYPG